MITMGLEGRKWELFIASVNLFAERGYNPVSVRDIASAVNIKAGTIYHYFTSKEEILTTIFDYDQYVSSKLVSVLDSAVEDASNLMMHPYQPLYKLHCHYDAESRALRNKILALSFSMMCSEPRAEALVLRNLVYLLRDYDHLILDKLIQLDRIEPLDIDTFSELHANHVLSCALRGNCRDTLPIAAWLDGLNMLFSSMIKLKETPPAPLPDAYFYFLEGGWV